MNLRVVIDRSGLKDIGRQHERASREHSRAMAAAGYELRRHVKEGMKAQAPGGETWPPAHPWTKYDLLRKLRRPTKRARKKISITGDKKPLARLAGAVRLGKQITPGPGGAVAQTALRIGFLTRKAAERALYHAAGPHTVPVTPRMRRFLFAIGLGIKATSLRIPRRAHVEPVYRKYAGGIRDFVGRRVASALAGGSPRGVELR